MSILDAPPVTLGKLQRTLARASFCGARKAAALGDSITNRSSAGAGLGYVDKLPHLLGTANVSADAFVEAGNPGENTAQMLARYDSEIRGQGVELLFLLCGTNDIGQSRTLDQWSADVQAIHAKCVADGIQLVIGTVPPRGGSAATSAVKALTDQYNLWLNLWAPSRGIRLAQVWANLTSQGSDGTLKSGYDSGDGVHPNTIGHQIIAESFADACSGLFRTQYPVGSRSALNLVPNPLADGAATVLTGWYEQPGGTGTAPTYSAVADDSGQLGWGRWAQGAFDATASGGTRYFCTALNSGWSVGDTLLVMAKMRYVQVGGTDFRQAAWNEAPSAHFSLRIFDQSFAPVVTLMSNTARSPGPVARKFTVPVGKTQLVLAMQMQLPTGANVRFQISEVGVFKVSDQAALSALA